MKSPFLGVSSASRSRITGIGCCEVLQDLRILKPVIEKKKNLYQEKRQRMTKTHKKEEKRI